MDDALASGVSLRTNDPTQQQTLNRDAYQVVAWLDVVIRRLTLSECVADCDLYDGQGNHYPVDHNVVYGPDHPLDFNFSSLPLDHNKAIKVKLTIELDEDVVEDIWFTPDYVEINGEAYYCAVTGNVPATKIMHKVELGPPDGDKHRSVSFLCRRKQSFTGVALYNLGLKVENPSGLITDWTLDPKIKNNG